MTRASQSLVTSHLHVFLALAVVRYVVAVGIKWLVPLLHVGQGEGVGLCTMLLLAPTIISLLLPRTPHQGRMGMADLKGHHQVIENDLGWNGFHLLVAILVQTFLILGTLSVPSIIVGSICFIDYQKLAFSL